MQRMRNTNQLDLINNYTNRVAQFGKSECPYDEVTKKGLIKNCIR